MSLATLGPITFEASADTQRTFRDARRSGDARWADHEVHLAKPKSEFLGPGLDTIALSVRLDIQRGVIPRDELRRMREQRDKGNVLGLIVGGDYAGDFTLRSLSEVWNVVDAKGVISVAVVELTLKEYV